MKAASPAILAVTGLHAEARIASARGVEAVSGGGDPVRLASLVERAFASDIRAVISFGIAGGLAPGLRPGTVVVADRVVEADMCWATDLSWTKRLLELLPEARGGTLAAVDRPVAGVPSKADLWRRTDALAVDMESHVAARLAAQHGVPFAALRVVADPANRSLPRAALVGMRPDGSTDAGAVLRALVKHPLELPALIQTALDARTAFASLAHSRNLSGERLGFGAGSDARETIQSSRPGRSKVSALVDPDPDRA